MTVLYESKLGCKCKASRGKSPPSSASLSEYFAMTGAASLSDFLRWLAFLQILKEDDSNWPVADRVGTQELEIILGQEHISFKTTKLGSLNQVNESKDPDGLRIFYYLVQVSHAKCLHMC